jgi:hypothetical protein
MEGLLKYNHAEADATGVAHDSIDSILVGNRRDKLEKMIEREGSIRAFPYFDSEEGKQTLLETAMGFVFPGAAVGRVAKGAVTGGHMARSWMSKYFNKIIGAKPGTNPKNLKGMQNLDYERMMKKYMEEQNKINILKHKADNAMFHKTGKSGLDSPMNDPVTVALRESKIGRNWDTSSKDILKEVNKFWKNRNDPGF